MRRTAAFGAAITVLAGAALFPLMASAPSAAAAAATSDLWAMGSGKMSAPRTGHTATLLSGPNCASACGKVLVTGGGNSTSATLNSAELYDPIHQSWSTQGKGSCPPAPAASADCPGPMNIRRVAHKAVQLLNGKVLVVGGVTTVPSPSNPSLNSAELYDPAQGTWKSCSAAGQTPSADCPGHMELARYSHTATLLTSGKVLVTGGYTEHPASPAQILTLFGVGSSFDTATPSTKTAELYNPADGTWSTTEPFSIERASHTATVLSGPNCGQNCDKVLVAGGGRFRGGGAAPGIDTLSSELFDPTLGRWTPTGPLAFPKQNQDALVLPDGKVLMAGGAAYDSLDGSKVETYDPVAGAWAPAASMNVWWRLTNFLAQLPGGRVIAAGAPPQYPGSASTETYDPATPLALSWKPSSALNMGRYGGQPIVLGCDASRGRVLMAGGTTYSSVAKKYSIADTYELYDRVPTVNVKALTGLVGPVTGGTAISIKGLGFKPITPDAPGTISVKFGDTPAASVTKVSENEITAVSPPHAASGKVDITVTVDGVGADTCKEPFQFTYTPTLAVAAITPPLGPATGGTAAKITGQAFTPASTVKFGDAPATKVSVNAAGDTITAETPAHDPGPVVVTINNGADSATTAFTYHPVVSGLVPPSGPTKGGTSVNIAGKGLAGATKVTFGGLDAKFTASDGAVVAETPPHAAGKVEVRIDTNAGVAVPLTLAANLFTYEDGTLLPKPATEEALGGGGGPGGSKAGPPSLPAGAGGGPGAGAPAAHSAPAPGAAPVSQSAPVSQGSPGQAPGLNPVSVQAPAAAGALPPASQPVIQTGPAAYLERPAQPVPGAASQAMVGLSTKSADLPLAQFAAAGGVLLMLGACFSVSGGAKKRSSAQEEPQPAPSLAF